jgi:hypothetical protein
LLLLDLTLLRRGIALNNNRVFAFLIDYFINLFTFSLVMFLLCWDSIVHPTAVNFNRPFEVFYPVLAVATTLLLLKDLIAGRSLGKRIFNLAVRNVDDRNQTPSIYKLILRNIPFLIWPVDVIYFAIKKERLGDRIFKTHVILIERAKVN